MTLILNKQNFSCFFDAYMSIFCIFYKNTQFISKYNISFLLLPVKLL